MKLFLALFLAATSVSVAQTGSIPRAEALPRYRQTAEEFFHTLHDGDVEKAFAQLTEGSEIATRPTELLNLKTKTGEGIELIGGVVTWELIRQEKVGEHLVRLTYLAHGKKYPLRWLLYFYEGDGGWRLVDLRVDDSLLRMFGDEESGQ